ncbi:MAG: hypothetical protein JXB88_11705 [Spirochaetales bacterium]|nr:hypothetical protein [Spirochaetales bacterium]
MTRLRLQTESIFTGHILAKIPTQADTAFLELSEKVGSILEKYKDSLKKKKEALELDAKMVAEYVLALRKRYKEQTAYLRSLDKTSEEFFKGYAELYNLAWAIRECWYRRPGRLGGGVGWVFCWKILLYGEISAAWLGGEVPGL